MKWQIIFCGRCKKEIKEIADYGGYAIPNYINLCSTCWAIWIEIKKRHKTEIDKFWSNK